MVLLLLSFSRTLATKAPSCCLIKWRTTTFLSLLFELASYLTKSALSYSIPDTVWSEEMAEAHLEEHRGARIQWTDVEASPGHQPRPALHRSTSNISINAPHSRRASIDPASALPIQYRTVSFQIAESKEKNAAELRKAKDNAAKGIFREFGDDYRQFKLT